MAKYFGILDTGFRGAGNRIEVTFEAPNIKEARRIFLKEFLVANPKDEGLRSYKELWTEMSKGEDYIRVGRSKSKTPGITVAMQSYGYPDSTHYITELGSLRKK